MLNIFQSTGPLVLQIGMNTNWGMGILQTCSNAFRINYSQKDNACMHDAYMCICTMYVCMYVCMSVCAYVCTMWVWVYVCVYVCVYVHMYALCGCECMFMCMYVCMCICMHGVGVDVCLCVCRRLVVHNLCISTPTLRVYNANGNFLTIFAPCQPNIYCFTFDYKPQCNLHINAIECLMIHSLWRTDIVVHITKKVKYVTSGTFIKYLMIVNNEWGLSTMIR